MADSTKRERTRASEEVLTGTDEAAKETETAAPDALAPPDAELGAALDDQSGR